MASVDARVRSYLLGLLPSEEAAGLEEQYFSDDALFEELTLAEDDLIDEYLDGGLSADHRAAFDARLAERPELRERVAARRMLTRALRRRVDSPPVRSTPRRGPAIAALAAAAALVFVVGRAYRPAPVPARPSIAQASPAPTAPHASAVVLLLGAGAVRGTSDLPSVALEDARPLVLRLPTKVSTRPVDVIVEDVDGVAAWSGPGRTVDVAGATYAEAEIAPRALAPGDYVARFRGLRDGEVATAFRIRR